MTKVKLIAGQGADEANFGSERYRVNNDRSVMVDEAAVGPLLAIGGFTLADTIPPLQAPHGNVQVRHRSDPTAAVSWAGQTFVPDADGILVVSIEGLADIAPHGFVPVPGRRNA